MGVLASCLARKSYTESLSKDSDVSVMAMPFLTESESLSRDISQ